MKVNEKTVFAVVIAVSAVLTSCGEKKQQQMPSATFKTTTVSRKDLTLDTRYSANIRGRQDVEIYPQVGGTIKQICVTEGQTVRKGQTLFVIDQVPYEAALNTAQAALKAAQASEATAAMNYESKKKLKAENVISDFDLQVTYNTLLTAKAQVAQAQAQVTNARNSLSYTIVTAPTDGVIGTLPYRQGALVGAQMAQPLTTVSDNSQMWVYFSISERDLLNLVRQSGSMEETIKNMPDVSLALVDGSLYDKKGRVESASGVVNSSTGSVQLRAVFDNENGMLHSGSTGNVIVPTPYNQVLVVPATAAVQTQDRFRVFLVDKDGIAHGKVISVDEHKPGNLFIVTEGLEGGEEIVAEGAGMVKEGQKVK
ncbi:MAG: efflux RND transporter periplasmic adaptor subunit [Bacteroidaceae bacterium]|nr:efflux RND transporter periplasmic adaptor subunit [Bacteroidaceae bacterium]